MHYVIKKVILKVIFPNEIAFTSLVMEWRQKSQRRMSQHLDKLKQNWLRD